MAFDVDEAMKKLSDVERTEVQENQVIRELITKNKNRFYEIDVNGVKIRLKKLIDRKTRHELADIANRNDDNLDQSEMSMYEVLAKMCVDPPFTNPVTWEYLDAEIGIAQEVLEAILDTNRRTEEDIKRFQPK